MAQVSDKSDGYFITVDTGEKIELSGPTINLGTAASQKIGLFGATAVIQQTAAADTNASVAGSGTAAYINTAFTSSVGTANYTVADIVKALKNVGILAQ